MSIPDTVQPREIAYITLAVLCGVLARRLWRDARLDRLAARELGRRRGATSISRMSEIWADMAVRVSRERAYAILFVILVGVVGLTRPETALTIVQILVNVFFFGYLGLVLYHLGRDLSDRGELLRLEREEEERERDRARGSSGVPHELRSDTGETYTRDGGAPE